MSGGPAGSRGPTLLWFLDDSGKVTARPVRAGITDGQYTQVEGPAEVKEGLQVIAAIVGGSSATTTPSNPFQQTQQRQGPPPPPGM